MKKWSNPQIQQLGIESKAGVGNEEYTDPSSKPSGHPDWGWCVTQQMAPNEPYFIANREMSLRTYLFYFLQFHKVDC